MPDSKQHSDTKMRPIRDTIAIAEALELILSSVLPVARISRVELTDAHRRVLSSNITANQDEITVPLVRKSHDRTNSINARCSEPSLSFWSQKMSSHADLPVGCVYEFSHG